MRQRKRQRLIEYDYSLPGYYYVTICTKDREHFFGMIKNGVMCVNDMGKIVWDQWQWLEKQYTYIRCDTFVVMPDHIHGILEIMDNRPVGTGRDLSLQKKRNGKKIKPLSEIIGALKMTSSKYIHRLGYHDFSWQRSFHDRIIRNPHELHRIRTYIINNTSKWV